MARRFLYAFAATAALVAAAPSYANSIDLGTISPGTTKGSVQSHGGGSFSDDFTFNIVTSGSDGNLAYTNFFVSAASNIVDATLSLMGPTTNSFYFDGTHGTTNQSVMLAAGNYTATLTGTVTGSDGGAYNLRITAPTPEPELWLSMTAGVGLAGFMARRRRKAGAATAAA